MSQFDEYVPAKGATFQFKRLKERKPGESWILLDYGPSKTGKTWFAGTAGPRTLFINVGDGMETLLGKEYLAKFPAVQDMIFVDIREMADSPESAFDKTCLAIDEALAKFSDDFDTIVLDEATAYRKYAMNKAMQLNRRKDGPIRNRLDDFIRPEIDDFGVEMDMIQWFLGTYIPIFKERKKHFIMLAHERQIFNKAAKIGDEQTLKKVLPGFTGKTFPDNVPAYFDDVWHSETYRAGANVFYQVRTAGSDSMIAGSRHGGVFALEEKNPNFLEMLSRIQKR